jgi:hypothetical protein
LSNKNTNEQQNEERMLNINIKQTESKFIKLYNFIEKRKYTDDITVDFIENVINNYDNI